MTPRRIYRLRTREDGMVNVFWRAGTIWMHCHGPTTWQAADMWLDEQIRRAAQEASEARAT